MAAFPMPKSETEFKEWLLELVRTLDAVVEQKDPLLRNHSKRVANNCANFCEEFKLLQEDEIFNLYLAGVLHDFGLIFFPDTLLRELEERTDDEKVQMRKHPGVGEKILSNLSTLKDVLPIIRHHHEAIDGSGYPDGLSGDKIPLGARIICIFNELDTLIFPFSKASALSTEEAVAEIKKGGGKQFDSNLMDQFTQFVEANPGESEDFLLKKGKCPHQRYIFQDYSRFFRRQDCARR